MSVAGGILGSVGSSVGTTIEGFGAADATKDYNAQLLALNQQYRDWNLQQFLNSRGQGGNALLPLYMPTGTEQGMANYAAQAQAAQQAYLGTPQQQIAQAQAATQGMMPAMNAGDALVNNLFSGQLANQQVANIQPVLQARGQLAGAQKEGILEGLQARLNAMSADRARAGYVGGGSAFEKNLLTGATIPALQQAGTVGAQANLANASDVANIRNTALQTQLSNLNLPTAQAANRIQLQTMPAAALGQSVGGSQSLMNWFKMNPQAYSWNQVPNQQLVPNTMMILGAGMAAGGQAMAGASGGGGNPFASYSAPPGNAFQYQNQPMPYYYPPNQGYDYTVPATAGEQYALYG